MSTENTFLRHLGELLTGKRTPINTPSSRAVLAGAVIVEKVLIDVEYEGVRRFFDRILTDHVPPIGERCPFATKERPDVLEEWPAISHERFNHYLAEYLLSFLSEIFKTLSKDDLESNSHDFLETHTSSLWDLKQKPEGVMFDLLMGMDNMPFVIMLLIRCIREYVTRPDVSNDQREALAHCLTLVVLKWVEEGMNDTSSVRTRIIILLLQSFDSAIGLSEQQNHVFAKWFFKIVNELSNLRRAYQAYRLPALGFACSMMKIRRRTPGFDGNIRTIAQSIFNEQESVVNAYFEVRAMDSGNCAAIFKEKGRNFRDVLSLSTAIFPDTSLLKLQVDWFLSYLNRGLKSKEKLLEKLQSISETSDYEDLEIVFIHSDYTNSFAFIETIDFFLSTSQLNELSSDDDVDMRKKLLSSTLDFYFNTLLLLIQISYELDLMLDKGKERESREPKVSTIVVMLWYLEIYDRIVSFENEFLQSKREEYSEMITKITRHALTALVDEDCCQFAHHRKGQGLVIYYPSEMYSEATGIQFNEWLKSQVETLWKDKGEFEFIEFLFKDELKLPVKSTIKQDEYILETLPCLLFSDIVSLHIPNKLSQNGLEYFIKTMKRISLPRIGKSLWDCIMQEKFSSKTSSRCKHNDEQIRIFKKKIEERIGVA